MEPIIIEKRCIHCQANLPNKAEFCPVCGKPVQETVSGLVINAPYTHCSHCKSKLEPEALFCHICGLAVEEMKPEATYSNDEQLIKDEGQEDFVLEADEPNHYPTLRLISTLFRLIGVLTIIAGILVGITWATLGGLESWALIITIMGTTLIGIVASVLYFALAESMCLIIDIEENQQIQIALLEELAERYSNQ